MSPKEFLSRCVYLTLGEDSVKISRVISRCQESRQIELNGYVIQLEKADAAIYATLEHENGVIGSLAKSECNYGGTYKYDWLNFTVFDNGTIISDQVATTA